MALEDGSILRSIADATGHNTGYSFMCPGCKHAHAIYTNWDGKPRWTFNGDTEKPTFSPSLLIRWDAHEPPVTPENHEEYKRNPWPQQKIPKVCHSFIRDGMIQFLNDCTHDLAGKIVPIPAWEHD